MPPRGARRFAGHPGWQHRGSLVEAWFRRSPIPPMPGFPGDSASTNRARAGDELRGRSDQDGVLWRPWGRLPVVPNSRRRATETGWSVRRSQDRASSAGWIVVRVRCGRSALVMVVMTWVVGRRGDRSGRRRGGVLGLHTGSAAFVRSGQAGSAGPGDLPSRSGLGGLAAPRAHYGHRSGHLVDRDGCLGLAGAAPAVPGDGDDVHRRGNAFVCPATVNVAGDALVSRNLLAFLPRILEDQGVCEVLVAEVRVALAVP